MDGVLDPGFGTGGAVKYNDSFIVCSLPVGTASKGSGAVDVGAGVGFEVRNSGFWSSLRGEGEISR